MVVAALALAFWPDVALAQRVEAGLKGGVVLASIPKLAEVLEEEGAEDVGSRAGFTAGAFVAFDLSDTIAIQPEVLYTQRGFRGDLPAGQGSFGSDLEYIDVPVLVRVGPASGRGFHVLGGASFNFLISAEGFIDDETEDIEDDTEGLDIGLVFGVGYYGTTFIVEGRYQEGTTNIVKDGDVDGSYRNRAFVALVGFRFW
jgi:hypothetical protein